MATIGTATLDPETATYPHLAADNQTIRRAVEEMLERARIQILDPDFISIFFIAVMVDALDIINLTGVGKILTILIDMFIAIIMFGWQAWRTQKAENAKYEAEMLLETYTQDVRGRKRVSAIRSISRSALRAKKLGGNTGRLGRVVMRTLGRVGLFAIAEIIPFLGLIPWWTILVILAFRQKIKLNN